MPLYRHGDRMIYFVHVPKTGGSTVEEYLVKAGAHEALKSVSRLGYSKSTPQHMHAEVRDVWIPRPFVDYSFAVVRHPLSRLVSEYHWRKRVAKKEIPQFDTWATEEIKRFESNHYILDNHLRPQVEFVSPDDEVFRLEDGLENPISKALSILGIEKEITDLHHAKRSEKKELQLSQATLDQILKFYAADFERFDYHLDSLGSFDLKMQKKVAKISTKALKGWQLTNISQKDSSTIVVDLHRNGAFFRRPPHGCKLLLQRRKPDEGDNNVSISLDPVFGGNLRGEYPVDHLLSGQKFMEAFDAYLQCGDHEVRVKSATKDNAQILRFGSQEIIPYKTTQGNASVVALNASSQPASGFDVAIFLNQINYTGGKTKAMLSLASQLKDKGLKVKIVVLTVTSEKPNFKLNPEIPVEFVQFFGWQQGGKDQWSASNEGFVANGTFRERAVNFLSHLGAKVALVPDYPFSGLDAFLLEHLPENCIKILSDHNPNRATYTAKNHALPSESSGAREFLESIKAYDAIHVINPLLVPAVAKETSKTIIYIPNGVERWKTPRTADSIFRSRTILALTRLKTSKQVDHLINAFAMIARKWPEWTLLILGRGDEEEKLRLLIKDHGLEDQINLAGFDPNINARFSEASFFVSAAAVENLSLAYLESMGTGTPMLTYDGNATAQYVLGENDENGFRAKDGDVHDLASAMNDLIQKVEARDPIVAEKAASAYEFTEQFDPARISDSWFQAITNLIADERSKISDQKKP